MGQHCATCPLPAPDGLVFGSVTRPAIRPGVAANDAATHGRAGRAPGPHNLKIRFSPLPPRWGGGGRPQGGLHLKNQRGRRIVPPTARPTGRHSPGSRSSASYASLASSVSPGVPGGRLVPSPVLALRCCWLRARNSAPSQGLKIPEIVAPGEHVAGGGPACAGRCSGAGGGAPGRCVAVRGCAPSRRHLSARPAAPSSTALLLPLLALCGLVVGRSRALHHPPLSAANGAAVRAGQGPRPPHTGGFESPPSPLRGARRACGPPSKPSLALAPGAALVAAAGSLLPRSQSCAPASLRFAPSAVGPRLRSSLRAHGSPSRSRREYRARVGSAGGIARTAPYSRDSRPWRAGVLPGVPPAPSMAPGQGL